MTYGQETAKYGTRIVNFGAIEDDYVPDGEVHRLDGKAWLPHSCDEWVIGGREEVEALIKDLQALLAFI